MRDRVERPGADGAAHGASSDWLEPGERSGAGRRERTRARSRRTSSPGGRADPAARPARARGSRARRPPSRRAPATPGRRRAARSAATSSSGMGVRRVEEHHVVRRATACRASVPETGPATTSASVEAEFARVRRDQSRRYAGPCSTSVTTPAPRDQASSPTAPDPAYRSRKRSPTSEPHHDSIGREERLAHAVARRAGAHPPWRGRSCRPPTRPPMIRVMAARGLPGASAGRRARS